MEPMLIIQHPCSIHRIQSTDTRLQTTDSLFENLYLFRMVKSYFMYLSYCFRSSYISISMELLCNSLTSFCANHSLSYHTNSTSLARSFARFLYCYLTPSISLYCVTFYLFAVLSLSFSLHPQNTSIFRVDFLSPMNS